LITYLRQHKFKPNLSDYVLIKIANIFKQIEL